jgi:dolichyl-diphosphooligosaccharide--protein glycosyltransferase
MLALSAIALGAFALRVAISYRSVFGQDFVAFVESDAWYHMRLVDGLIRHFPWRIWHDAYLLHPGGEPVNVGPMLDWIIAGIALVLGVGSPSPRLVDAVGAFVPPVLGALTVVPVYALAKDLFSTRAGLWAAFCAAVLPGALLTRSALGFTDHHCAEVLFTTLTLMCVVRAIDHTRSAKSRSHQAIAAGVGLGTYLLTWGGGALFVATLALWAGLELVVARLRDDNDSSIVHAAVPIFVLSALMVAPWAATRPFFAYDLLALAGGLATIVTLYGIGYWTTGRPRGRAVYFGLVAVVGLIGALAVVLVARTSLGGILSEVRRLSPLRATGYVREAVPLMRSAEWRPVPLWNEFTTSLPLCLLGLLAGPFVNTHRAPGTRLLLAWGLVALGATFGQVRFAYYLAIPVAIFAGYGCDLLMRMITTRSEFAASWTREAVAPMSGKTMLRIATASVVLAVAIAGPGAPEIIRKASLTNNLGPDWIDTLRWMRTNTPEPFGSPDAYYLGGDTAKGAYGVMSWWDYGYWITRIGRRVPIANPKQSGVGNAAQFFLSTDPQEAGQILSRAGARYVIADAMLQFSTSLSPEDQGFFSGIATANSQRPARYCEALRPATPDQAEPSIYCYPEYYETMAVRLYAFGGRAVTPQTTWVIDVDRDPPGRTPRIRSEWSFPTYEEALSFSRLRPDGQLRIVSKDPLSSCVPLDPLPDFVRVYRSIGQQGRLGAQAGPPVVQVYEYRPQDPQPERLGTAGS